MPHDLDLQMHMNNECYPMLMDPGRIALMKRTGLLSELRRPHVYCSCWTPNTSIPRPGAGRIRQPVKAIAGSAQARIMSAKSPPEILDG